MDYQQYSEASAETAPRKLWKTPVVTLLPVENTAVNASTGNDGNGPFTGS